MKIFSLLKNEIGAWAEAIIRYLPGTTGYVIRYSYWKIKFKKCGKKVFIGAGVIITGAENIELGENVSISAGSYLYSHANGRLNIGDRVSINTNVQLGAAENGEIIIKNDVLIASNVVIRSSNHKFDRKDIPIREQGHTGGKIVIENDVWIGSNAVILPDITINKGAIVGAGSVVTKDVPAFCIVAGVPAKTIRERT